MKLRLVKDPLLKNNDSLAQSMRRIQINFALKIKTY